MGLFIENNPTVIAVIVSALVGIAYWAGSMRSKVNTLERFMDEIRTDIKKIFEKLPASTVSPKSPLQLTDLGKSISEEVQASSWAKQVVSPLVVRVKGKHPYEIQEFCLEHVKKESVFSKDMDEKIQTSAYEHGIDKEGVLRVLAVELRDALLRELGVAQES